VRAYKNSIFTKRRNTGCEIESVCRLDGFFVFVLRKDCTLWRRDSWIHFCPNEP